METKYQRIIDIYSKKFSEILGVDDVEIKITDLDIINDENKMDFYPVQIFLYTDKNWLSKVYTISDYKTGYNSDRFTHENCVFIGYGELKALSGCNSIGISSGSFINNPFKNIGLGKYLHYLKIDLAKAIGYKYLLCTVVKSNLPERKILEKNNWVDLFEFHNDKTGNDVIMSILDLSKIERKLVDSDYFIGKTIKNIFVTNPYLENPELEYDGDPYITIEFDKTDIKLFLVCKPECCNLVHLETNENLDYYIGSKFLGLEINGVALDVSHERERFCKLYKYNLDDCVNASFIYIKTSLGKVDFNGYSIHNGYYGGFDPEIYYGIDFSKKDKLNFDENFKNTIVDECV